MSDRLDNLAFNYTKQDNTHVDLFGMKDADPRSEQIHDALMVAGFVPGLGNIADAADALLYAFEGEFGNAAISAAAMLPFIGQFISGKRALKAAKESGEKMRTFYRGVEEWHPSRHQLTRGRHKGQIINTGEAMVKNGKFIGGGDYIKDGHGMSKNALWVSEDIDVAKRYLKNSPNGRILEFEVPAALSIQEFTKLGQTGGGDLGVFANGLDKIYLTSAKVHK